MNISVLGCGRWGTFLAWYSATLKHEVKIWGRETSTNFKRLVEDRKNEYLELPDSIMLTSDLHNAVSDAQIIIISISAQNLRTFAKRLNEHDIKGKTFVLCMKGMEAETGKRLTEVFKESITQVHILGY